MSIFQNKPEKVTGQFKISVWNQCAFFAAGSHRLCFPVTCHPV